MAIPSETYPKKTTYLGGFKNAIANQMDHNEDLFGQYQYQANMPNIESTRANDVGLNIHQQGTYFETIDRERFQIKRTNSPEDIPKLF